MCISLNFDCVLETRDLSKQWPASLAACLNRESQVQVFGSEIKRCNLQIPTVCASRRESSLLFLAKREKCKWHTRHHCWTCRLAHTCNVVTIWDFFWAFFKRICIFDNLLWGNLRFVNKVTLKVKSIDKNTCA